MAFTSTPIQARTIFMQEVPPDIETEGVIWVDTSGESPVMKQWYGSESRWRRIVTVASGDTEPNPSDVSIWVDDSEDPPETKVYSEENESWELAAPDPGPPPGTIVMWSGSVTDVPDGWTLCDGTDGTYDLTDRFIVGSGGDYETGDTGGTSEVQLSESEIPSHNHTSGSYGVSDHDHGLDFNPRTSHSAGVNHFADGDDGGYTVSSVSTESSSPSVSGWSGTTGSDEPHENRPPYCALAYIQKL